MSGLKGTCVFFSVGKVKRMCRPQLTTKFFYSALHYVYNSRTNYISHVLQLIMFSVVFLNPIE